MDLVHTTEVTHTVEMLTRDLHEVFKQSYCRGLIQSSKWASEMLRSLKDVTSIHSYWLPQRDPKYDKKIAGKRIGSNALEDCDYMFAKCVFDLGEYKRSAFLTEDHALPEARFLHYYSLYLSIEKERKDRMIEPSAVIPENSLKKFADLSEKITNFFAQDSTVSSDAYMQYVLGITLIKIGKMDEARKALAKSIASDPLCWCSWIQLAHVIEEESVFEELSLPNHWLKNFFSASVSMELQNYQFSHLLYKDLEATFFENNYIRQQIALTFDATRQIESAIEMFTQISLNDPYRLEARDVLSHLLFMVEDTVKLSQFALEANQIDPFRMETCLAIANFYNSRGNHEKAIIYFSRALLLNPNHASAWVLMGHEYVELKNSRAAIQAYRSALKCNKRNYRAWYGLGQVYEILKMYSYSLYYYNRAHYLQPKDHRFLEALGLIYEKLGRNENAVAAYSRAGLPALYSLGTLYEKLGEDNKAAAAYNTFITNYIENKELYHLSEKTLSQCYISLGNYFVKHKKNPLANRTGVICMNLREMREDCRDLIKYAKMFIPLESDEEGSEDFAHLGARGEISSDDELPPDSDNDVSMEI